MIMGKGQRACGSRARSGAASIHAYFLLFLVVPFAFLPLLFSLSTLTLYIIPIYPSLCLVFNWLLVLRPLCISFFSEKGEGSFQTNIHTQLHFSIFPIFLSFYSFVCFLNFLGFVYPSLCEQVTSSLKLIFELSRFIFQF